MAEHLAVPPGLLLALALWTDMPEEDKAVYQSTVESLVAVATAAQLKLPFEEAAAGE